MIKRAQMKRLALNAWMYGLGLATLSNVVSPSPSYGFFDLSIMGGANFSNLDPTPNFAASTSSGMGLGLGALLNVDLMPLIGLESGLFYQEHKTTLKNVGNSNFDGAAHLNQWSIPIMLRLQPVPFFALEGGGYIGIQSSNTVTIESIGTLQGVELENGHGLIIGVSFIFPMMPALNFRVSGFYEYGLSNLATDGTTLHARNIDIFAGLMLDL